MSKTSKHKKARRSPVNLNSPVMREALSEFVNRRIDPLARRLYKASGVLACLQAQAEYGEDNVDLADVASVAIEIIDQVIRGLDSVNLLPIRGRRSTATN